MKLKEEPKEINEGEENTNVTVNVNPPIYILSCVNETSLSNIRKSLNRTSQTDFCVQCHSGTIRNFVECNDFSLIFYNIIS